MSETLGCKLTYYDYSYEKPACFAGEKPLWHVPLLGLLPSAAQGFSLNDSKQGEPQITFLSFPYYKKYLVGALPILRVARPMVLRGGWDRTRAGLLVSAVRHLGKSLGAYEVELEIFSEVKERVFFPSSSTAIDTCNDPQLFNVLTELGLVPLEKETIYAWHRNDCVDSGKSKEDFGGDWTWRTVRKGSADDRRTYEQIWLASGDLPVAYSQKGGTSGSWLSQRPWYDDVSPWISQEDAIIFAEYRGEAVGFIHWWPNMYRVFSRLGRSFFTVSLDKVGDLIRENGEAKIFKLAVLKSVAKQRTWVANCLVQQALYLMVERHGLSTCQISLPGWCHTVLEGLSQSMGLREAQQKVIFAIRV